MIGLIQEQPLHRLGHLSIVSRRKELFGRVCVLQGITLAVLFRAGMHWGRDGSGPNLDKKNNIRQIVRKIE